MAKEQTWDITIDGVEHQVTYVRQGLRSSASTLFVDNEEGKLFWPRDGYVDEPITIGGKECRFIMRGYNADVVVDGVCWDSGKTYQAIAELPAWYRFITAACLLLYFFVWRDHMWIAIAVAGIIWLCGDRVAHSESIPLKAKKRYYLLIPMIALIGSILVKIFL
ncbi:MAG: hypothetical protein Q3985_01435 [Eubacteriales bacterium]|nr:hypothetical protein [Eubacteriales bacterium]